MSDIKVKCTRCRNQHMKSERKLTLGYFAGVAVSHSVCPRCSCKSYLDMTPQFAWCWASGLIEIGDELPADNHPSGSGVIQIATGPKCALQGFLDVVARHGKGDSAGKLLVPGVPEAPDGDAAIDALKKWLAWCESKGGAKRNGIQMVLGGRAE
ncbi:hypothetical protein [Dickeya dianthicola]|uniref:hypothetical protein n=1 Tax=Dickeya dianthicola TaxID=204039 RepID=UPI000CD41A72|nr:hypothetical protein [Dickeya dianthicola]MBI0436419.1 hypothetical protein [Dickeya dianthicola]MBI0447397.1 hypothetical protein [Dickeya dianthicola]MBI0451772.1 hypothetical protein [Dickeya dianthicola]MBI0456167.1 hypothetical protein [Dickeya dianthicola]MBI0460594.1 hypothetical protein [Dickeya dianthicola]